MKKLLWILGNTGSRLVFLFLFFLSSCSKSYVIESTWGNVSVSTFKYIKDVFFKGKADNRRVVSELVEVWVGGYIADKKYHVRNEPQFQKFYLANKRLRQATGAKIFWKRTYPHLRGGVRKLADLFKIKIDIDRAISKINSHLTRDPNTGFRVLNISPSSIVVGSSVFGKITLEDIRNTMDDDSWKRFVDGSDFYKARAIRQSVSWLAVAIADERLQAEMDVPKEEIEKFDFNKVGLIYVKTIYGLLYGFFITTNEIRPKVYPEEVKEYIKNEFSKLHPLKSIKIKYFSTKSYSIAHSFYRDYIQKLTFDEACWKYRHYFRCKERIFHVKPVVVNYSQAPNFMDILDSVSYKVVQIDKKKEGTVVPPFPALGKFVVMKIEKIEREPYVSGDIKDYLWQIRFIIRERKKKMMYNRDFEEGKKAIKLKVNWEILKKI